MLPLCITRTLIVVSLLFSSFLAEVKEGKRVRGWVPRKLLKVVESPQAATASNSQKKVPNADRDHFHKTEQNQSTYKKDGDGRNIVNSSVSSKDGKKKKKKANHKKND